MKFVLILFFIAVLTTSCALASGGTPTPRPTYTPYPTFTPSPEEAQATLGRDNVPTVGPGEFVELDGRREWLFGSALTHAEEGMREFRQGRYQAAIENFREAQKHRNKPSAVLENWIANCYQALGEYDSAIQHHSSAINISDSAADRVGRGTSYLYNGQCDRATEDAKAALAMEPEKATGLHTDAEANQILANCYAVQGEHLLALQHAEVSLSIAVESGYGDDEVSNIELTIEEIRLSMDPDQPYQEFFVGPAMTASDRGEELFEHGQYEAALKSFKDAQEYHGKPSSVLESWIGLSYQALEQHDLAIVHFTNSIGIDDGPIDRANRGISYSQNGQCGRAIKDAEIVLSMEPYTEPNYHSDVEAHLVLAICRVEQGDYLTAYEHTERALSIARANNFAEEEVAAYADIRDEYMSIAEQH